MSEVNCDPRSECTRLGKPTLLNISNKASATVLLLISFNGIASGNLVHMSIVVRIYLYPSEAGLIGPIRSTHIIENGVPINGNFPIGALGTVPFDTFL